MKQLFRHADQERGFTAIEALVSVVILSVVILVAVTVFQSSNRASRSAVIQGDTVQSGRLAVDVMTRDLRSLGYDLDFGDGQRGLVYAAPWDMIFNANLSPAPDDPVNPGFPRAMDLSLAPATVAGLYVPAGTYGVAETVRYTLDSTGDGAITADDAADDPEEGTPNPRDYVLMKRIYGALPNGTNGGAAQPVAVVRGPDADPDGRLPSPLFSYWLDDDDDRATPEVLHGDINGDGRLSQSEIASLTPVPPVDLPLVTRAIITVTTEDGETGGRPDYRTRELVSSVSFRNDIRRSGIIVGFVYVDMNGDGVYDIVDETPLPGVLVRLNTGLQARTRDDGRYLFEVEPGPYTVTEFDPPNYQSTTPNVVAVTADAGAIHPVSFGDRPVAGIGTIRGVVYEDANMNAVREQDERLLQNVLVSLHTGAVDTTDVNGAFWFDVPVGAYTVVETDSVGWNSTTNNVLDVTLTTDGEVIDVEFGDVFQSLSGTITGKVYLDLNYDGILDPGEEGIADVPIQLSSGDSTVTTGNGDYSFTVAPGIYHVMEEDLDGYTSTTPNFVLNVFVFADSTVEVNFGDLYNSSLDFTIVSVGQTDRALSIDSANLKEDNKGDSDIILGTESAGLANNLLVWHNKRLNSGTAITGLFSDTPTFTRNAGQSIPAMVARDENSDSVPDVVTGLDTGIGNNLQLWVTRTSGSNKGTLPNSPTGQYATGSPVLTLEPVVWPSLNMVGYAVGTKDGTGYGHVEIWHSSGSAYLYFANSEIHFDSRGALGEVTAIATGYFDQDGDAYLAIGQDMGGNLGRVSIFKFDENLSDWEEVHILDTEGAVLAMKAVDMKEDDAADLDLVLGTSKGAYAGVIELWLNDAAGNFGVKVGNEWFRSDWIDAGGEVLSLSMETLDPDVFPDVIVGLRTSQYAGALKVYRGIGYLPSAGTEWSYTGSGEVVTQTVDDFNLDGLKDIAVGTRTAVSTGELIIYFGQ